MKYLNDYIDQFFHHSKYANTCLNRKDFWLTILYVFIAWVVLVALSYLFPLFPKTIAQVLGIIWIILACAWSLISLFSGWTLITRRLHDTNRDSIWLVLSLFIPVLWIAVIVLCLGDSVTENNKFFK